MGTEETKEAKVPVEEQEVSRDEVYQKYNETIGQEIPLEAVPVETVVVPEKQEEEPKPEEKPAEEEVKEEPVKTEEELQKEQEKENNLKEALRQEREKKKRLKEEKEALEAKIRELTARQEPPKEPEPIADYDAELNTLKSTVKAMQLLEAQRAELARQEAIRQEAQKLKSMVTNVHNDLLKEGYAGFEHMAGKVTEELIELSKTDPEEAQNLDNPDGWKKIFKETVYPKFKKDFEVATRTKSLDDKKALKKDVNLNTSSGKAPVKKDDDDPDTWSEEKKRKAYLSLRREY